MPSQLTGTGLDRLVNIIETDSGIARRVSASDIDRGAQAASELNHMIVEGIREMGLANDGTIDTSDLRALGDWAQAEAPRYQTFVNLYGTNRNGVESGFQLVENEDSSARLFGEDAVDEVADAIYSFGFGDRDGRLIDVNGDLYRSVTLTARWVDDLLTDADMKALSNPNGTTVVEGTTGTGLDRLVDVVNTDAGLIRNISRLDIADGAKAVDALNNMFLDGITTLGLAKDGSIDRSDVTAISDWVRNDPSRKADFMKLYDNGYDKIYNQGADIAYIGVDDNIMPHVGHVINHGMRGVYQIGFGTERGQVINDNGNPDISTAVPANWFDQLLTDADMRALSTTKTPSTPPTLDQGNVDAGGADTGQVETAGTGLDRLVDIINADAGLVRNISRSEITDGARAAAALNDMIVDTIETLGLGTDGRISRSDVMEMNSHIRADGALHDEFLLLRGENENGTETGLQLVLNEGGATKLFDKWAVDNVADAVYHVGLEVENKFFLDDDGDRSYSVSRVAEWIDDLVFT